MSREITREQVEAFAKAAIDFGRQLEAGWYGDWPSSVEQIFIQEKAALLACASTYVHPKKVTLWVTADGQQFHDEASAAGHAARLSGRL
jgi:hypothetical protein